MVTALGIVCECNVWLAGQLCLWQMVFSDKRRSLCGGAWQRILPAEFRDGPPTTLKELSWQLVSGDSGLTILRTAPAQTFIICIA